MGNDDRLHFRYHCILPRRILASQHWRFHWSQSSGGYWPRYYTPRGPSVYQRDHTSEDPRRRYELLAVVLQRGELYGILGRLCLLKKERTTGQLGLEDCYALPDGCPRLYRLVALGLPRKSAMVRPEKPD